MDELFEMRGARELFSAAVARGLASLPPLIGSPACATVASSR